MSLACWTNLWSRVHEFVPYQSLNGSRVDVIAKKLARMIVVLQPMLEEFVGA